jgi:hypothetical protein
MTIFPKPGMSAHHLVHSIFSKMIVMQTDKKNQCGIQTRHTFSKHISATMVFLLRKIVNNTAIWKYFGVMIITDELK